MVKQLLEKQLRRQRDLIHDLSRSQGFTLIELLIVVIIASVIVSALLALVVQLVGTEQRESVRTETQREMQLAMNYIASDLRQAVYIYEGKEHLVPTSGSDPSYIEYFPSRLKDGYAAGTHRPVLAFWKTKPLENINNSALPAFNDRPDIDGNGGCQSLGSAALVNECNNLWLRRQNYSLVAYFQVVNDENGKWKGKSRIDRYELDKYENADLRNLDRRAGYVDPAEIGSAGFISWPYGPSAGAGSTLVDCQDNACEGLPGPAGEPGNINISTLVDYVDYVKTESRDGEPDDCGALQIPGNNVDAGGNSVIPGGSDDGSDFTEYFMTPRKDANFPDPAFFICLRNTASPQQPNNARVGQIQDTVVFLRGNANGRGGTGTDSFLPTLQTRITMRGVIDRVIR